MLLQVPVIAVLPGDSWEESKYSLALCSLLCAISTGSCGRRAYSLLHCSLLTRCLYKWKEQYDSRHTWVSPFRRRGLNIQTSPCLKGCGEADFALNIWYILYRRVLSQEQDQHILNIEFLIFLLSPAWTNKNPFKRLSLY